MIRADLFLLAALPAAAASLSGVVDIHVHADPDSTPRAFHAADAARMTADRGFRAILLKNHYEPTASLAYMVRLIEPRVESLGAIVLNRAVGGLNAEAIDRFARVKGGYGRMVFMPTRDAENNVKTLGENRPYVAVTRDGSLLPEAREVLRAIARNKLALATGHLEPEESLMLIRAAREAGIERIVVTHALLSPVNMSVGQMKAAAGLGAYIEFVCNGLYEKGRLTSVKDYAEAMRAVGTEHCILSSDFGQPENPSPAEGLEKVASSLRRLGFTDAELDRIMKSNPAHLLGLDPPVSSRSAASRR